ncbi:MAG TPA: protein kinase [Thermoanaerobaculia bacterium]|nr:protein kinase [Thermoanaerobaculia bacterium]
MAERDAAGARLAKLGRYEVLSELGKGAMGIVYLARDPVIGRMVAIKTIRASSMGDDDSESREFRERFIREAQTAGILSHPNIVTIHDIGEDPDTQISFIAMEYIEGKTLKGLLMEKAPFTSDQVADMIAQVAEAMDYAHRKGIIHRDIKPANIIVTADEKVKITDFGIAKIASSNLTTTGQFLGTPNYMSPEQVSGSPVDGRSDIFSLGVVLYELLTRRKPFSGENLTAISYKIVHEDFTPPADLSSEVPPEFNPIVGRAMAKDPWNRYQRGKDFALALQQLRAHLEEQKAMADLGTVISGAPSTPAEHNAPTAKMENLAAIAAEGAREAEASASRRPTEAAPVPGPGPAAAEASASRSKARAPSPPPSSPAPAPTAAPAPASAPPKPPPPPAAPARRTGQLPPRPDVGGMLKAKLAALKSIDWKKTDWRKVSREQVNPYWFWRITIGVGAIFLLIVIALLVRSSSASRPSVAVNEARVREVADTRKDLEEGRKLLAAGKYQESLVLFRKVLEKDPNSNAARQYVQTAEAALAGKQEEAKKTAEVEKMVQDATTAFNEGNYEAAKKQAEDVLALDANRAEAQKIRDDSEAKIAEADAAAKKKASKQVAAARKPTAVPVKAKPEAAPTAAPAPVQAASAIPILRLLFDSPVSEGHLMVAVNDQILLRKPFSFVRKEGLFKTVKETGTVDVSIPVQAGALNVKVWLSGPDIPASTFATTSTQMPAGGSRVLRVDFSGGHLGARIQ